MGSLPTNIQDLLNSPSKDGGRTLLEMAINIAKGIVKNSIDAEECVQESIKRWIRALQQNPTIKNPSGYLYTIVRNTALEFLEDKSQQAALHERAGRGNSTSGDPIAAQQLDAEIAFNAFRTKVRPLLKGNKKFVADLRIFLDVQPAEIAQGFGISEGTVSSYFAEIIALTRSAIGE